MRIAVYTCSLNEEKFAERWAESAIEADQLLVLDTGSTDRTVATLHDLGVMVGHASIRPWRFDDAKNCAMSLLSPTIDVAIQMDMDEVLVPNWRDIVCEYWKEDTTKLKYKFVWSWTAEGKPDKTLFEDRICGRHTHRWKGPVHEYLSPTIPEIVSMCPKVLIEHHPDENKSRRFYLDLLELAVREDPFSDRNSHYLGREYFFNGRYEEAIAEFQRHIRLPSARWPAERAASLRYGAKCFEQLDKEQQAYNWFILATLEDRTSREALVDLAAFLLRKGDWNGVIFYSHKALEIPVDQGSYLNERYALEEGPYDLASVAFWKLGDFARAHKYAHEAYSRNPHDPRLLENLVLIEKDMK